MVEFSGYDDKQLGAVWAFINITADQNNRFNGRLIEYGIFLKHRTFYHQVKKLAADAVLTCIT